MSPTLGGLPGLTLSIAFEGDARNVCGAGILTSACFDRLARTVFSSCESLDHRFGGLQIRVPDFLSDVSDELVTNKKKRTPCEWRIVQQTLAFRSTIHGFFIRRVTSE